MHKTRFVSAFCHSFPDLEGQSILVALSGGADSVALVILLAQTRALTGCRVATGHVHHHARGRQADDDAVFCGELCRQQNVDFRLAHIEKPPPAGTSAEAYWRAQRYRLLDGLRRELDCHVVATAHTLDDQAETVLLKLFRGSGPRGVAGIRTEVPGVIRPLLGFRREELRAFLREQGVVWREDATNADLSRPRAWIRHHLLPQIDASFPRTSNHLAAFAEALAADEEYFASLLAKHPVWPEVGRPVELAGVAALPPVLRLRWLLALASRLPLSEPPSRDQLFAALNLFKDRALVAVDLGKHWILRRRGEALHLCPPPIAPFLPVPHRVGWEAEVPGGFVARVGVGDGSNARLACYLDLDKIAGVDLFWRSPRPGERFTQKAQRRISALLAGAGVPVEWRRAWPLLTTGDTIVWLPGVAVAPGWEASANFGVRAELEEPWGNHVRWLRVR